MDLVIKNGTIVTAFNEFQADIGIENGKIVNIGECSGSNIIDAKGNYIFPGMIDMHTHINHWGGTAKTEDDFLQGHDQRHVAVSQ